MDDDALRNAPDELQRARQWRSHAGEREREEEEEGTGAEAHRQRERDNAAEPVRASGLSRTQSSLATRSEIDGPDCATPHAVRLVDRTKSIGSSPTRARTH